MPKKALSLPTWQTPNIEPKRKFKFILAFGDIPAWVVKSAARPNVTVSEGAKHQFLSHEFKFPGRVTWNDIDVTLVDPIDPIMSLPLFEIIEKAGYQLPSNWTNDNEGWKQSLSKRKFSTDNLGDIAVKVIDSDGKDVEIWRLHNAWVKSIDYSDVDYSSEELMEIKVSLSYDWASIEIP
jgi:hypothetical protein